jgi:hypothetical protein
MEYISIDPVEELIKAVAIVHGAARADMWRRLWSMVLELEAKRIKSSKEGYSNGACRGQNET